MAHLAHRGLAGALTAAMAAALLTATAPSASALSSCTEGDPLGTGWYSTTDCVMPGAVDPGRTVGVRVYQMSGAGGGGGHQEPYASGGDGALVAFDLSVPTGSTAQLVIGSGGLQTDDADEQYHGAGGGGSTAIVIDGVPYAEAGGGGGATNAGDGGAGGRVGEPGSDGCSGGGGNSAGAGSAGVAGPYGSCAATPPYPIPGHPGMTGWGAAGGTGASDPADVPPRGGTGGQGYGSGGDGGDAADGFSHYPAAGGGGGYGGGGGGAAYGAPFNEALGSGGGGGSNVDPRFTVADDVYYETGGGGRGGSEDDGNDGEIMFTIIGAAVKTAVTEPTGVTGSQATLHSAVDVGGGTPIDDGNIVLEYTTDPTFATGVQQAPGSPSSLATGSADITTALTGLTPGVTYYYRIRARNTANLATVGTIEHFTTKPSVSAISPARGPESGGTTVTLTGTGFRTGMTVTLGGAPCTPVTIESASHATCRSGAHPVGPVDVKVDLGDDATATLPGAYTYEPAPLPPTPPTPTPAPTARPTPTPTPTPTPDPTPRATTTLRVSPAKGALRPGKRQRILRATTNGSMTRVHTRCRYRGHVLHGRDAQALCGFRIDRNRRTVVITAAPSCTAGLRLQVQLTARKGSRPAKHWSETWRVGGPVVRCALPGTG